MSHQKALDDLGGRFSGHVRPRQGTEICNFGAPSPLEALDWIFCFFSRFSVQFSKTSPPKSGESSEKSSGENRVKSCHVCGCHGFFGPEFRIFIIFFCSGGGEGGVRGAGRGGDDFLLKIPGGGVSRAGGGGGVRGRERVCREFGGRGAKYFFSGPNFPPSDVSYENIVSICSTV